MANVQKPPKEKSYGGTPKIIPRPTAASQARAARIANNRSAIIHIPKQSPTRQPSSPGPFRGKSSSSIQSHVPTLDSRMSINSNKPHLPRLERHYDRLTIDHLPKSALDPDESNIKINESRIIIIDDSDNQSKIIEETRDHFENLTTNNYTSRPETPRSRPVTPANNYGDSRPRTPGSRPTTPLNRSRPRTPSIPKAPDAQTEEFSPGKEDLKGEYLRKQKLFQNMKKELDFKQQSVLEIFANLKKIKDDLNQQNMMCGDENVTHQDLMILNVADWAAEEIAQLCRDATTDSTANGSDNLFNNITLIDENIFSDTIKKINEVPDQFENICLEVLASRQEVIDWAKDFVSNEDGNEATLQKINDYSTQGSKIYEGLLGIKNNIALNIDAAVIFLKNTYKDCNVLHATGENILRELEKVKLDIMEQQNKKLAEICEQDESSIMNDLQDTQKELEQERLSKVALKNKLIATESQLRATRIRVNKMEKQIQEAEASIVSLTSTVKSLEEQNRHNEIQLESKARKMRESLKIGDEKRNQLNEQRDKLNNEIQELKEAMSLMTEQHKITVNDLNSKLKAAQSLIKEKSMQINEEVDAKIKAEETVFNYEKEIKELNNKLIEIENNKFNPDIHNLREMELWAELSATQERLRLTTEEIQMCKEEKIKFLNDIKIINERDSKDALQHKFAQELISKEELISQLQTQINDLLTNTKLNEEKVFQYEQFLSDQYAFNKSISNNDNSQPDNINIKKIQQEVISLRVRLVETVHRNNELEEVLQQKKQQIEQQEKSARSQLKVIKVRDELIEVLQNKDNEQRRDLAVLKRDIEHRMKIVEDVNKQIAAKGDEIQEVFATLETKQQHIHRLEKIVIALEDHQRRAQAQRVRNEEKIALLEHEIDSINKRNRKFIFF